MGKLKNYKKRVAALSEWKRTLYLLRLEKRLSTEAEDSLSRIPSHVNKQQRLHLG